MEVEISRIIYNDAERFRKDLGTEDELNELSQSIESVGLLYPVIISRDYTLRAGRRRLEALKRLGRTTVRAEFFDNLDPIAQKIVELDENKRRKQLTWQEEASALAEIHSLLSSKDGRWGAADTARTLKVSEGKVSEDLVLASNLGNARIAGRPSRRGALVTVKRERELTLIRELASRRSKSIGLNVQGTQLGYSVLYNRDCREVLKEIAKDSIDLIVMDPPWGVDLHTSSQWTGKWVPSYNDNSSAVQAMLTEVFPLLYKTLKPSSHIYTFAPVQEVQWWLSELSKVGFTMRSRPLIWFKTGQPGISDVYTSFLPCYEAILWGFKGEVQRLLRQPTPEAFGYPRTPCVWHENDKPTELLTHYIEASSEVNEVILDPFMGGGSTLASAFMLGRYAIGIEIDPVSFSKAQERLVGLENPINSEEVEDERS